jgi:hypothetical protein
MSGVLTYLRNAEEMAGRALVAREAIYQGKREAEARARRDGTSLIIEVQTWMGHEQCKALVADNQWNMKQSIMYAQLAQARVAAKLAAEAIKQTELLAANNELLAKILEALEAR